jgi:flagellar protein FliO/FliZ
VIDLWESLIRTLSALAIVLVLMGLLALAARRLVGHRWSGAGMVPRPLVQVLGSGYIGPRKTIALVSVAGEYLVVGTTATDLVPLGRIENSGTLQELLASYPAASMADPSGPSGRTAAWLQQFMIGPHKDNHDGQ